MYNFSVKKTKKSTEIETHGIFVVLFQDIHEKMQKSSENACFVLFCIILFVLFCFGLICFVLN